MEYRMIGGDGIEYGPVSLDEMRTWIREGRIGRNTLISRSDTRAWNPASTFSELEAELTQLYGPGQQFHDGNLEPVGFWPRLGAYLLDHILLTVLLGLIWFMVFARTEGWQFPPFPTGSSTQEATEFAQAMQSFMNRLMLLYYPLFLCYDGFLNGRFGATFGKMLIGARIVRLDGSRIGYGIAVLRWLAALLSAICGIGYLFIAFRSDKRGLHDLIVGTRVVYRK